MTTNPVPRKRQATWRKFDEIKRSTCGNCPAGCGVKGFIENGTLVDLFGDEDHPTNKGSFCPKGLLSWVLLGHPDRICQPRIRDRLDQNFRACTWPEALDKIASQLGKRGSIVLHSDESVSFGYQYGASLFAQLGADVIPARIVGPGGFGTKPFGPAGRIASMFGLSADRLLMNSQRDWAFSRCVLLVGADLGTTDPMTLGPLVDVRDRGGSLIVIDSKTTISAVKASYHIRVNPGTEAAFLAAVVRQLMTNDAIDNSYVDETIAGLDALRRTVNEFTLERTAQICGVLSNDIETIAGVVGGAHPIQVMCGDWLGRSRVDDDLLGLGAAIVLLRGSVGVPGGGLNLLGASPFESEEMECRHLENEILHNEVSTLVLHGNPVARFGGGARVRERLSQVPLVVQMGGFSDETSVFAHVQLPLTTWVEEAGLNYRNNGRAVQWREPLVSPRGQCRPALDIWFDLIAECGFPLPQFGALRGVQLAVAVADEALRSNDLTRAIRVSDLTLTNNPPGGVLWPNVDAKEMRFEDDRFGRGDVRGRNILFRRHRPFAGSNHRFPIGNPMINLSGSFTRSVDEYELPAVSGDGDHLKMIVTVGVDFIPGWSGGKPTPGLAASLPVIRIHPETGLRHDLVTGALATVSNNHGLFEGRVELSLTVGPDVLWCIETPGHGERPMTGFGLVDVPADGMPRPAYTWVKLTANAPRRNEAFAMMLGRQSIAQS